jgi:hypothetical protein
MYPYRLYCLSPEKHLDGEEGWQGVLPAAVALGAEFLLHASNGALPIQILTL